MSNEKITELLANCRVCDTQLELVEEIPGIPLDGAKLSKNICTSSTIDSALYLCPTCGLYQIPDIIDFSDSYDFSNTKYIDSLNADRKKTFDDFLNLSSGRERIIIFDIPERKWSISTDPFIIARMKANSYRSLPYRPYILTSGRGALESDVYNYLYCIGYVGLDCSGFVWHILSYIGRQGGVDLGAVVAPVLGIPSGADSALYAGTAFLNSVNPQVISVNDEIRNLRPADVLLFRDIHGVIVHAAIIQSIDWTKGIIRYLQCNNIAPMEDRGVHDSYIYFDPSNTSVSLKDPSLHWTKLRFGAFPGEEIPFVDDGERYRYRLNGGGRVVRLQALVPVVERMLR